MLATTLLPSKTPSHKGDPAKTTTDEDKIDKEYSDESADLALRSSDGVTFLVHSYHLMSGR